MSPSLSFATARTRATPRARMVATCESLVCVICSPPMFRFGKKRLSADPRERLEQRAVSWNATQAAWVKSSQKESKQATAGENANVKRREPAAPQQPHVARASRARAKNPNEKWRHLWNESTSTEPDPTVPAR